MVNLDTDMHQLVLCSKFGLKNSNLKAKVLRINYNNKVNQKNVRHFLIVPGYIIALTMQQSDSVEGGVF